MLGNISFTNEVIANTTIVNGVPIYNNVTKLILGESQNNLLCVNKCYKYLGGLFIVIGSIILLLNAFYALFIANIEYASDKEWSRYLVLNVILWACLIGFVIGDYLVFLENMNFYSKDPEGIFALAGTATCQQLFQINLFLNLIVAVLISVLGILLILKIILIARQFFMVKYVPHSAISNDEDIIVYG